MLKTACIVPSFNQAEFLSRSLDSVLSQSKKFNEIVVCDGGSTDGSIEIIKKNEDYLTWWYSHPDGGQSAAINSGVENIKSDYFTWLNSDDVLNKRANEIFHETVRHEPAIVYGLQGIIDERDKLLSIDPFSVQFTKEILLYEYSIPVPQPGTFFNTSLFRKISGLNPRLNHCMDWDLFLRLSVVGQLQFTETCLGYLRRHDKTKSYNKTILDVQESLNVFRQHGGAVFSRKYFRTKLALLLEPIRQKYS